MLLPRKRGVIKSVFPAGVVPNYESDPWSHSLMNGTQTFKSPGGLVDAKTLEHLHSSKPGFLLGVLWQFRVEDLGSDQTTTIGSLEVVLSSTAWLTPA